MVKTCCDECGAEIPIEGLLNAFVDVGTGRVLIDGLDAGQSCDLCPAHKPPRFQPGDDIYTWQPTNCTHVRFHFSRPQLPDPLKGGAVGL